MTQGVALIPVAASNAGGGNRTTLQRNCPTLLASRHGNRPVFRAGGQAQHSEIATSIDKGGTDAALSQLLEGGVNRHALGDSAEIEFDVDRQRDALILWLHVDAAPSSSRPFRHNFVDGHDGKSIKSAIIAHLHQL